MKCVNQCQKRPVPPKDQKHGGSSKETQTSCSRRSSTPASGGSSNSISPIQFEIQWYVKSTRRQRVESEIKRSRWKWIECCVLAKLWDGNPQVKMRGGEKAHQVISTSEHMQKGFGDRAERDGNRLDRDDGIGPGQVEMETWLPTS
ncbi:hypothetical protein PoB_002911500 [Plakobranchus ocellatus]|uniref:Uncharacterized protein n=1 Tax=Plakobranchus ocellatus TaxID=259542 RepID=A0AAV4A706_9GAST|nr:hypothetical protein PoB_002911500 [Plakobranchus ocellatus]